MHSPQTANDATLGTHPAIQCHVAGYPMTNLYWLKTRRWRVGTGFAQGKCLLYKHSMKLDILCVTGTQPSLFSCELLGRASHAHRTSSCNTHAHTRKGRGHTYRKPSWPGECLHASLPFHINLHFSYMIINVCVCGGGGHSLRKIQERLFPAREIPQITSILLENAKIAPFDSDSADQR